MMEEEKEEMEASKKPPAQEEAPTQTQATANGGVNVGGVQIGGGMSFFQKLKTTGQEEAKNKLSMGFKRLPI
jgi:hypothetical protein